LTRMRLDDDSINFCADLEATGKTVVDPTIWIRDGGSAATTGGKHTYSNSTSPAQNLLHSPINPLIFIFKYIDNYIYNNKQILSQFNVASKRQALQKFVFMFAGGELYY
jgi:hypothetical protein